MTKTIMATIIHGGISINDLSKKFDYMNHCEHNASMIKGIYNGLYDGIITINANDVYHYNDDELPMTKNYDFHFRHVFPNENHSYSHIFDGPCTIISNINYDNNNDSTRFDILNSLAMVTSGLLIDEYGDFHCNTLSKQKIFIQNNEFCINKDFCII